MSSHVVKYQGTKWWTRQAFLLRFHAFLFYTFLSLLTPFFLCFQKKKFSPQAPALWDWLKGLCFNCLDNVVAAILLKAITPAAKSQAL